MFFAQFSSQNASFLTSKREIYRVFKRIIEIFICFFNFDEITTVKIPASIESIGDSAFACCYQLTNIIIGENVKTIENQAFSHCYELKSITFPPCLTSIGNEAFRSCINLSSVTFVADIKEIGNFAFYRCPKVIINAPAGSEIEKYAKRNNLKFNAL